jgi:hypothetical protein
VLATISNVVAKHIIEWRGGHRRVEGQERQPLLAGNLFQLVKQGQSDASAICLGGDVARPELCIFYDKGGEADDAPRNRLSATTEERNVGKAPETG